MTPFSLDTSLDTAETALRATGGRRGLNPDDLLCDLCHWIDAQGGDVEAALRNAEINWRNERRPRP